MLQSSSSHIIIILIFASILKNGREMVSFGQNAIRRECTSKIREIARRQKQFSQNTRISISCLINCRIFYILGCPKLSKSIQQGVRYFQIITQIELYKIWSFDSYRTVFQEKLAIKLEALGFKKVDFLKIWIRTPDLQILKSVRNKASYWKRRYVQMRF